MISTLKLRHRYYLCLLGPGLIFSISFYSIRPNVLDLVNFLIGFLWPLAYLTPEIESRVDENKYKYSFMRVFISLQKTFDNIFPEDKRDIGSYLTQLIIPLIICGFFYSISSDGNILFTIVGFLFFKGTYFLIKEKTSLIKIQDVPETHSSTLNEELYSESQHLEEDHQKDND